MTTQSHRNQQPDLIKAAALKPGDRVGLVAPASRPFRPSTLELSDSLVREMGFQPVIGESLLKMAGYLAGKDSDRLSDINGCIHDDSIAAIFCVTGGYGSLRLLPGLDYDYLRTHPKILVGCDDNTSWLTAIHTRTGLVTFHGPNLDQITSASSFERFKEAVTQKEIHSPISASCRGPAKAVSAYAPVKGSARGRLIGGNLTALISLMGTPWEPTFENSILILEDVEERNDILDRWFTTLYVSGALTKAAGVVFGEFVNCGPKGLENVLSLEDLFGDRLKELNKPCFFDAPVGQTGETATLPIGVEVSIGSASGTITFLEAAVL